MTMQEWDDRIDDMDELIDWCRDNNLCTTMVEDIIDGDQLDDYVEDDISDRWCGWQDLASYLSDIPTGYSWYRRDGSFDYVGLSRSDFIELKDDISEELDNIGFFDDEDEEEEYTVCEQFEPQSEPEPEEEFEIMEFNGDVLDALLSDAHDIIAQREVPEVIVTAAVPEQPVHAYDADDGACTDATDFEEAFDDAIRKLLESCAV